jgi:hypothetical protein
MKNSFLLIILITLISFAGQWESFDLRDNGTITV